MAASTVEGLLLRAPRFRAYFVLCAFALFLAACKEAAPKLTGNHASPETAYELGVDKTVSGVFDGADASIFIRVRLKEAAMLRAELSAARGVDSSLAVFNPPDKLMFEVDDAGSSLPEEITPVFLPAGDTLIRLRGKGGEQSAFTFFYRTFQPPSDIEHEPNNSAATANTITGLHMAGFYGPEFDRRGPLREREKDCFVKENTDTEKKALQIKLTGVDGILSSLTLRDAADKELLRQEATAAGAPLFVGPVSVPSGKFYICVAAVTTMRKQSRDYYDLTLTFAAPTQKGEIEPNDSPGTASAILEDQIEGVISTFTDSDYFSYRNRREYPVSLRIELESASQGSLSLSTVKTGQALQLFEDSAAKTEVAENIRLEAGEGVIISVKNRAKLKKKNFKPTPYTLKLQETQASDENETEPNHTIDRADGLVDLTQKWGFINPVGDVDYYRIKLSASAERVLTLESKIDCKVRLEHLRGGKSVAVQSAPQNVQYKALFEKDDVVKVQCVGQKSNPAERAYRIALTEP